MEKASPNMKDAIWFNNFTRSFISGFISGAVAKTWGHPLDTIKTRIQITGSQLTLPQHFTRIIEREGFTGLFKGVTSPVLGTAPLLATMFATNDLAKRTIKDTNFSDGMKEFIPGCCAGASILFFTLPIEILKVKKQGRKDQTKSYGDIVKSVLKKDGIRGLYRGFSISFWLCVPTSGLYFYNYHKFQQIFRTFDKSKTRKNHRVLLEKIFAGGIAGQIGWLISYPFDAVKTFMQYHPDQRSPIKSFRYLYATHGVGYFYRGCYIAMLRAFPVSAITFWVYDYVHNLLSTN